MANLVSDDQWRAALNAIGAEDFDTGQPFCLRGKFTDDYVSLQTGEIEIEGRVKVLRCVTADVAQHALRKQGKITRIADGSEHFIRRIEHREGGTTVIVLSA